jgi:E3 ubiquitin-protein ligase HUWE1
LDSYFLLRRKQTEELKQKLNVRFQGEEGVDAGGLTKEWFLVLSREMFNPNYALFMQSADKRTFQPNPTSYINPEHLDYFKFVGRVIAMAIYNEQLLDCFFTRSFYKHILGINITYHDIESIDPEYYKNLQWMLDNDITDIMDLTFTAEVDEFGKYKVVELKPGGTNIPVTNENKYEYVKLITENSMTKSIKQQLNAFLESFYEIIPKELISVFNEQEIELLISGLPEIDIDDLRRNTEYVGYTESSPVITWFWNTVQSFDRQEKALLLQFCTGTSKVPLAGFKSLMGMNGVQRFNIHRVPGDPERLPTSHTCFNQLDLPEYESEEILKERLILAIREGSEGFGFV